VMPRLPEGVDIDLEHPGGRFTSRPAVAIEGHGAAELASSIAADQDELGAGRVVEGSVGRGGELLVPVVEWAAQQLADSVVDLAIGAALAVGPTDL
jgi:hypothetical protein